MDTSKRFTADVPVGGGIRYRRAGRGNYVDGKELTIRDSLVRFKGKLPLPVGSAAEVYLAPEARLTPPVTAYFEVKGCVSEAGGDFWIEGTVEGIKTE